VKAAVLHEHGATPRFGDFDDPVAGPGHAVLDVRAAAIHHLDLHKASGTFYMGPPPLPSVVGTDGVGVLADGRRVYFDVCVPPYGSMAERVLASEGALFDIDEGIADDVAAALGNTGIGAWLAVSWRARLRPGETVLVLGAAGAVGSLALQAAKLLGAGRVVAAGLAEERLTGMLDRGADAIVELDRVDDLPGALREAAGGGVDVTIDTLWGEPAVAAMAAANRWARHVQVGQMAGHEIPLAAPALRSVSLDVLGFSIAHPPEDIRREGFLTLTRHVANGDIALDVETFPLAEVETAWDRQRRAAGGPKLVLLP
jgi:NADPH:quinone reductase-like Zn-dependent oxidoreductase